MLCVAAEACAARLFSNMLPWCSSCCFGCRLRLRPRTEHALRAAHALHAVLLLQHGSACCFSFQPRLEPCTQRALYAAHAGLLLLAVTPPGFKTSSGDTTECENGTFRSEWRPPDYAPACLPCGDGIESAPRDNITQYDPVTGQPSQLGVRGSPSCCCECNKGSLPLGFNCCFDLTAGHPALGSQQTSLRTRCCTTPASLPAETDSCVAAELLPAWCCFWCSCAVIKPGCGMLYSGATNTFWAMSCDYNNYGTPTTLYGLVTYPCYE